MVRQYQCGSKWRSLLQWGQRLVGSALKLVDTSIIVRIPVGISRSILKYFSRSNFRNSYWGNHLCIIKKRFPEKNCIIPSASAISKCQRFALVGLSWSNGFLRKTKKTYWKPVWGQNETAKYLWHLDVALPLGTMQFFSGNRFFMIQRWFPQ